MISPKNKLFDYALKKYNMPIWTKKYILNYLNKRSKIESIKHLMILINKRKKPVLTKTEIKLPNGLIFEIKDILYIISLFYFGELLMQKVIEQWLDNRTNIEHTNHFINILDITKTHERTIKNLLNGFKYKINEPPKNIKRVFEYIENIKDCNERIIIIGIILQDAYVKSFGNIFYEVFFNLSPEYMKLIKQSINYKLSEINWFNNQAKQIIKNNLINESRLISLSEDLSILINNSIKSEMKFAQKLKIRNEVELIRTIAIAYIFHDLYELNVNINIDIEMKKFKL